jgi:hypothetical protein
VVVATVVNAVPVAATVVTAGIAAAHAKAPVRDFKKLLGNLRACK